jgi:hypothetical protein
MKKYFIKTNGKIITEDSSCKHKSQTNTTNPKNELNQSVDLKSVDEERVVWGG